MKCTNSARSRMDANMQLTINSFGHFSLTRSPPMTLPWLLVKSRTFHWQLSKSLTFPGFPCKWSSWIAHHTSTVHTQSQNRPNWLRNKMYFSNTCSEIATGRKLDTFFRAADNDGFSDLTEIATNALKLCRRHFDNAAVVGFLRTLSPVTNIQVTWFMDVSPLHRTFRPLDVSPPGRFAPWTFRPWLWSFRPRQWTVRVRPRL